MTELVIYCLVRVTDPPVTLTKQENGSLYCDIPVPIPDQLIVFGKGEWADENRHNVTLSYKNDEIQLGQINKFNSCLMWKRDEKTAYPEWVLCKNENGLATLIVEMSDGLTLNDDITDRQDIHRVHTGVETGCDIKCASDMWAQNTRRSSKTVLDQMPNESPSNKVKTETLESSEQHSRITTPKSEQNKSLGYTEMQFVEIIKCEPDETSLISQDVLEVYENVEESERIEEKKVDVKDTEVEQKSSTVINGDNKEANAKQTKYNRDTTSDGDYAKLDTSSFELNTDNKALDDHIYACIDQKDSNVTAGEIKDKFELPEPIDLRKILQDSTSKLKDESGADVAKVIHTCIPCNALFTSGKFYIQHLILKHGIEMPKDKGVKEQHTKQKNETNKAVIMGPSVVPRPYKCYVSGHAFQNQSHLAAHKRTHTGEKPYKCDVCGNAFSEKCSLNRHMRTHKDARPKIHVETNKDDESEDASSIRTEEKPYKCDICGQIFCNYSSLTCHKRIHTGEKPHLCDICGHSFKRLRNLTLHKRKHTGEKPYVCEICGHATSCSSRLLVHQRMHSGNMPFQCDICGRTFSLLMILIRHKKIHTGEKPYKCDECEYKSNYEYDLKKHKRKHTGEKPYKCDECGHKTVTKSDLNKHKRKHTGEKPYKCDECELGFSAKKSLIKHKRKHIVVVNAKPCISVLENFKGEGKKCNNFSQTEMSYLKFRHIVHK